MQRYLSAIGFSPDIVTRAIIADGLSAGDKVQLIQPQQDDEGAKDRASNAIDGVQSTLSGVVSQVNIEVETIANTEFSSVVDRCSELIVDGEPPVVCLGAGASDIHVPMTVAVTAHQDQIKSTMMYSDLKATAKEIEIPHLMNQFPNRAQDTFQLVSSMADENPVSLSDLSTQGDASRPTIGRHIQALEKNGFVTTVQEGKSKKAILTALGKIASRLNSYN